MRVDIEHTFSVNLETYSIEVTCCTDGDFTPGTNNGDDCDHASHGGVVVLNVDATLAEACEGSDDSYVDGVLYHNDTPVFTRQQFIEAAVEQFEDRLGELMAEAYERDLEDRYV